MSEKTTPQPIGAVVKVSTNQDRKPGDEIVIADSRTHEVVNVAKIIRIIVIGRSVFAVIAQIIR